LSAACRKLTEGIFIDQSDGICVLRARGPRTRDLLVRLGDSNSVPHAGEAKRSRLGDVPVLAVGRGEDEVWLIVDRVYREHLLNWIGETAADLEASGAMIRDI
jgi:sarcosine oxidase gamma subunit